MFGSVQTSLFLCLPVVLAGIFHMVVVKLNLFRSLAVPIWASALGPNKTWRGILVMPLCGILGLILTQRMVLELGSAQGWLLLALSVHQGALLGLAYVIFELPNSFLKRRLGIPPGGQATQLRPLFFALDHLDSLTGCVLVYAMILGWQPALIWIFVVGPLIHTVVNIALWAARIRKSPW